MERQANPNKGTFCKNKQKYHVMKDTTTTPQPPQKKSEELFYREGD